ncbi:Acyl carrier protein [subsurface metagenome]
MSSSEEKLKEIVVRIVHCEAGVLTPTSTWQDIKADSLDLVQVLVAVEDTFDIEVPDEDLGELKNLGEFIQYIDNRVAEKSNS